MEMHVAGYAADDSDNDKRFHTGTRGREKMLEMSEGVEHRDATDGAPIDLSRSGKPKTRGRTVVLRVDNLDQTRATLMRQGVQFESTVQEISGTVRIATFKDSAGNRLQLCQERLVE
jgi:predicted enzyme related to lactoylglutathione lyase